MQTRLSMAAQVLAKSNYCAFGGWRTWLAGRLQLRAPTGHATRCTALQNANCRLSAWQLWLTEVHICHPAINQVVKNLRLAILVDHACSQHGAAAVEQAHVSQLTQACSRVGSSNVDRAGGRAVVLLPQAGLPAAGPAGPAAACILEACACLFGNAGARVCAHASCPLHRLHCVHERWASDAGWPT